MIHSLPWECCILVVLQAELFHEQTRGTIFAHAESREEWHLCTVVCHGHPCWASGRNPALEQSPHDIAL